MRKIISKKEEEKRGRRNQFIIGGILILVMMLSVIGYSFNKEEKESVDKIIYNGIEFIKESNSWNTNIENFQFSFRYNPKETEEINSELNLLDNYENKPLYIYSENTEAEIEIYRNLFYQNQIVQRVQDACLGGEKCDKDSPIKNCENNFIIIKESNNTEVKQQENCVFIRGKNEDLVKISDSFLFKIIGLQ